MFDALQETIDRLSIAVGRSVVLDDAAFHLLASSPHYGDVDAARLSTLINREPDARQREHLGSLRLNMHHGPTMVAPHPESGFVNPRVCVPIRSRVEVLGYLWITATAPLLPPDCYAIADAVETLEHMLHNMFESISSVNAEVESQTITLLAYDQPTREAAAQELKDLGMFNRSNWFVALALDLPVQWTAWSGPSPRRTVFDALWRAMAAPTIDSYTFAPSTPDTIIIVGYRNRPPRDSLDTICRNILRELKDPGLADAASVGVGSAVPALADVWRSFDQASVAAGLARRTGQTATHWEDAAMPAAISAMLSAPAPHLLPPVFAALETAPADVLELLETYFDSGGSVAEIAARLNVHRGTVYYRLRGLADAYGIDLDDGDTRFALSAWIQLRRRA
ncbi:PucR family transcriptional regulator [Agromyces humatus]|uniref:Helix-turn-helix domain-containing protein n=1 Tax=Agromyces humatus TaxID=279573 RepID=A0ABN2KMH3_9MICO|nr:helix-turn-helix domain-containing protein [Agromyces humatus]